MVPHWSSVSSKAMGCSWKINVGQYRLAKCSAAVVMQNDNFLCFCFQYDFLWNCTQSHIQISSADCVTDPMISSATSSVASQFIAELVLEDVEQNRRNGFVAVCSLLMPGSLTCCCLECVGNFQMVS